MNDDLKRLIVLLGRAILDGIDPDGAKDDQDDCDNDEEEREQCEAETKDGCQCSRMAEPGAAYCWQHQDWIYS